MIDGSKITLKGEDSKRLQSASGLRLVGNFDRETGFVFESAWGKFPGFYVTVKNEFELSIQGSFHVFYNQLLGIGPANADQFTFDKCTEAIALFSDLLRFEPNDLPLSRVEFGLNLVNPSTPVSQLLSRALMLGSTPFEWWSGRIGKEIDRWDDVFKFYDKVAQQLSIAQRLDKHQKAKILQALGASEILRVEFKSKRTRRLEQQGVETVGDLLRIDVWKSCYSLLEECLAEMVFAHTINEHEAQKLITPRLAAFLAESKDIDYWERLTARQRRDKTKQLYSYQNRFNDPPILPTLIDHAREAFAALIEPPQVQKTVVFPQGHETRQNSKSVVFPPIDNSWKNDTFPSTEAPTDCLPALAPIADGDGVEVVEVDQDSASQLMHRTCLHCGNAIGPRGLSALYCRATCKIDAATIRRRSGRRNAKYGNAGGGLFDGLP